MRGEGGSISFLSVDIANTRPIFRKKKKKVVISHWFHNSKHLALNAYTQMVFKMDTSFDCSKRIYIELLVVSSSSFLLFV